MLGVPLLKNRRICNLKRYYIHKSLLSPSCLEELEVEDMLPSVMDGDGIVSFACSSGSLLVLGFHVKARDESNLNPKEILN